MGIFSGVKGWFKGIFGGGKAGKSSEQRLDDFTGRDRGARERERKSSLESLGITEEDFQVPSGDAADDAAGFVDFGQWVDMQSSNVVGAMYEQHESRLTIGYKDGSFYQYQPVMPDLAREFFFAPSKGSWVWSELRVRGSVYAHQVNYVMVSGPARDQRQWTKNASTRHAHGRIWPAGEREEKFPFHTPNARRP